MNREQMLRELARYSTILSHTIAGDAPLPVCGMTENASGDYVRWSDIETILNSCGDGWVFDANRWRYLVEENNKGLHGKFRIVWFENDRDGFSTTDGVSVNGKDENAIVRLIDAAMISSPTHPTEDKP